MFKIQTIANNIYWVSHPIQDELGLTFCRLQEYYESPYYAGKVFTFEEYKQWYINDQGQWSYTKDWIGFNIPDYIVRNFFTIEGFRPLEPREEQFYNLLMEHTNGNILNKDFPYYIIGTNQNQNVVQEVVKHEVAHALFYTTPEYVQSVYKIIVDGELPIIPFVDWLLKGYNISSAFDELQAYALDDFRTSKKGPIVKNLKPYEKTIEKLKENYKKFVDINALEIL